MNPNHGRSLFALTILTASLVCIDARSSHANMVGVVNDLLGLTRGRYAERLYESNGATLQKIYAADLDKDGDNDVVGIGYPVSLFLNDGAGGFGSVEHLDLDTIYSVFDGVIADFDGDGRTDIAAATHEPSIVVFLNKEDGGFMRQEKILEIDQNTQRIVAGDPDGNGVDDLFCFLPDRFIALRSNGDGTFTREEDIAIAPTNVRGLLLDDVTGDAIDDLLWSGESNPIINILPGVQGGGFGEKKELQTDGEVWTYAVHDFSGDGVPDLAAGTWGSVYLYTNLGDAAFSEPDVVELLGNSTTLAIDFKQLEGDSEPRMIAQVAPLGPAVHQYYSILPDDQGGYSTELLLERGNTVTGVLADFTGDGLVDTADLAAARHLLITPWRNGALHMPLSNLDLSNFAFGPFQPALREHFAVGDIDGNGFQDMVTQRGSVLVNMGEGLFESRELAENNILSTLATDVAIVNLDETAGGEVLVSVSSNRNFPDADVVRVYAVNGDGEFPEYTEHAVGAMPLLLETGDLNGDDHQDVVTLNRPFTDDPSVSILHGNGSGGFDDQLEFVIPRGTDSLYPEVVAVGQIDGDTHKDVAVMSWALSGGRQWHLTIIRNQGAGSYEVLESVPLTDGTASGRAAVAADITGDTYLDLVVPNIFEGKTRLSVLVGDGAGGFESVYSGETEAGFNFLAAHQIDQTGGLDLVALYGSHVRISYTHMTGAIFAQEDFLVEGFSGFVNVADLNSDDWPELVSQNGLALQVNPAEPASDEVLLFRTLAKDFGESAELVRIRETFRPHAEELETIVVEELQFDWLAFLAKWLSELMAVTEELVNGEPSGFVVSQELIDDVNGLLEKVEAVASPELTAALDDEKAGFDDLQEFLGMGPMDILERLDIEAGVQVLRTAYEQGFFRLELFGDAFGELILQKTASLVPAEWLPVVGLQREDLDGKTVLSDPSAEGGTGFYRVVEADQ